MELVTGALGQALPGDNPQPAVLSKERGCVQGGGVMSQVKAQQAAPKQTAQAQAQAPQKMPLRELSVMEVFSMALDRRRRTEKESRRVVLFLRPHLIPPKGGVYDTVCGSIRIYSKFVPERGQWLVEVKLPPLTGFTVADHIKPDDTPSKDSQP